MSVTSEPIRFEYDTPSKMMTANDVQASDESFSFPTVLRGAAYISSGGRIYRLFSENDEVSLSLTSLDDEFRLEPLPEIPPSKSSYTPSETNLEFFTESFTESVTESVKSIDFDSLPVLPTKYSEPVSLIPLFAPSPKPMVPPVIKMRRNSSILSVTTTQTEDIRRIRAVEGICPSNIKVQSSEQNRQISVKTADMPTPVLKLFDVFPEAAFSQDVPSPVNLEPQRTPEQAEIVTKTPAVQLIRLAIHRPRKQKRLFSFRQPALRQWENENPTDSKTEPHQLNEESIIDIIEHSEVSDELTDSILEVLAYSEQTKKIRHEEQETSTEMTEPPSVQRQSIDQPDLKTAAALIEEPDTLAFPLQKSVISPEPPQVKSSKPWQLVWQPHWPEYLKSLESAASDQICFLADHLEVQHKQGRKVISFNSFHSGDGCTTLALCAARELAERGYRLLLADAHCQNPELLQLLRLNSDPHLYEIITLIPNHLELLPWSGTSIEIDSHNEQRTQSFAEIVGSLRNDYDFILLDNGGLVEYPLAERVLQWRDMGTDGVLLILNTKNPAPVDVQEIARRLQQYRVNLVGIAENYV